jgi:hypothetical protein
MVEEVYHEESAYPRTIHLGVFNVNEGQDHTPTTAMQLDFVTLRWWKETVRVHGGLRL